ncbi:MAG TPA: L,D-transpeptidase [Verrucomicrobiota bacterium]|nr:L,D-transpeptidase [Verrucomicrobiota bacterium]HNU51891.1 L,D-transpeptidase [Verrucomicrobiota bacterium]
MSVARQRVGLFEVIGVATLSRRPVAVFTREFLASTSRHGVGQVRDSNRTPLGLHRIAVKAGGGWPPGVVLVNRKPIGFTWQGRPAAAIAHRVLWLEGLEPGLNRGGNVDTYDRFIYIHGVGDETTLGRPCSRGCVHLAAADLILWYDRLPCGTLVWIEA